MEMQGVAFPNLSALLTTNSTNFSQHDFRRLGFFTKVDDYVTVSVYMSMAVLGVTFNLLAIFVIKFGKSISKQVKIQLTSLAVADLITAACFPAINMVLFLMLSLTWTTSSCRLLRFVCHTAMHASPLCNAAISLERLVVVFFPFKASQYTRTHKYIIVAVIWLIAILEEVDTIIYARIEHRMGVEMCVVSPPMVSYYPALYKWLMAAKYVIPTAIIVVCYALVYVKIGLQKRSYVGGSRSAQRNSLLEGVQAMLLVEAIITVVTWLPYNLYSSIKESMAVEFTQMYTKREIFVMDVTLAGIMSTNAFSTPIVYFLFNKHFRADTMLLLKRLFRRLSPKEVSYNTDFFSCKHSSTLSSKASSLQLTLND